MLDVHVSKERLSKLLGGCGGEIGGGGAGVCVVVVRRTEMSLRVIKHIGGTSGIEVPKAQLAGSCENTQRYVTQQSFLQS